MTESELKDHDTTGCNEAAITSNKERNVTSDNEEENCYSPGEDNYCSLMIFSAITGLLLFNWAQYNYGSTTGAILPKGSIAPTETSVVPSDGPDTVFRSANPPRRFFSADSIVLDSFDGQLSPVILELEKHGYIFVMYYSHWSLSSTEARDEFEEAASVMQFKVPFAAVNCWYSTSQCRQKYRFPRYPAFYVYVSGQTNGYSYSGVPKAHFFLRFIQSLLNPMTHIHDSVQLNHFISTHDASLVGYFDVSQTRLHGKLLQFYYASLRSIETDFIQPVKFGVLSNKTSATEFAINEDNGLLLVRPHAQNLVYPSTSNFTASAINTWLNRNTMKPVVDWLFPTGMKSIELYKVLSSGPVTVLFTPFDPCSTRNDAFLMMREVALSYLGCNATSPMKLKLSNSILYSNENRRVPLSDGLCQKCRRFTSMTNQSPCCYTVNITKPANVCEVCIQQRPCRGTCTACESIISAAPISNTCFTAGDRYGYNPPSKVCCGVDMHSLRRITDPFIRDNSECHYLSKVSPVPIASHSDIRLNTNGSTCTVNRTMNFIAMDTSINRELARRLQVEPINGSHHVVLVDVDAESYHIMQDDYNKVNLVNFLEEYSSGQLSRPLHTPTMTPSQPLPRDYTRVQELNSLEFLDIVANQHTDKVVMFYSKWCIHCKVVSHTFLTTQNYMRKISEIKFYRLDVSSNTLPWKYTVTTVPSIILFPARADSEVYPQDNPITTRDITEFILNNCSPDELLHMALRLPYHATVHHHLGTAIHRLQGKIKQSQSTRLQLLNFRKLHRVIYRYSLPYRMAIIRRAKQRLKIYKMRST